MSIIDLPLEVLDLIFKDLESQKDKLHLALVHPLLGKAFSYHSGNKYYSIDSLCVPITQWPVILPLCGSTVIEFKGYLNDWDCSVLKLIEEHCSNLVKISLDVNQRNYNGVKSLLSRMRSPGSVEVGLDCRACLGYREFLFEFNRLQKLSLKGCPKDEIYFLKKLINLEELAVTPLSDSEHIDILGVCSALHNLRSLTIAKMNVIIPKEFGVSPCPSLENLLVVHCHIPTVWPLFPKLKHLRIRHTPIATCQFLNQWVLQHSSTLERLELLYLDEPLQESDVLQVLQRCRKLQFFSIVLGDSNITETFVNSIMDILNENGFKPEKPFELKVFKLTKYAEVRKLLAKYPNTGFLKVTTDYPANPYDWKPLDARSAQGIRLHKPPIEDRT
ncbi:uncharacterized protein LOC111064863 [Drosophila obscura]|uniref:uncharacterized protein LOC111064863 n=1 Tax=Drosophila obscura TaxID=7282 RepID=UPI001BB27A8B|nr:uncharacterized protein LOC111064863 [Drosophila obscura]